MTMILRRQSEPRAKVVRKPARPASEREDQATPIPSLAQHPRAQRWVARARGWGALCGFVVTAWLSSRASVPIVEALLRSLAVGVATMLLAWAAAVSVWRQLALAEIHAAQRRVEDALAETLAQLRQPGQPREGAAEGEAA